MMKRSFNLIFHVTKITFKKRAFVSLILPYGNHICLRMMHIEKMTTVVRDAIDVYNKIFIIIFPLQSICVLDIFPLKKNQAMAMLGLYFFALRLWSLAFAYPVPPLCKYKMSSSFKEAPVRGWVMSFLIIFSTQSTVTTSPVVLRTATAVESLRTSLVTGHLYLSSLLMRLGPDDLGSIRVNFMSRRSLTFSGFPDIGHRIFFSGLATLVALDCGVRLGNQKLGISLLARALFLSGFLEVTLDELPLVPGWGSLTLLEIILCSAFSNCLRLFSSSYKNTNEK